MKGGASKVCEPFLWAYIVLRRGDGGARIGMSVSKKVGIAVHRNFVRRVIRETFRTSFNRSKKWDILIVVSPKLFKKIPEKRKVAAKLRKSLESIFSKVDVHA